MHFCGGIYTARTTTRMRVRACVRTKGQRETEFLHLIFIFISVLCRRSAGRRRQNAGRTEVLAISRRRVAGNGRTDEGFHRADTHARTCR